jgi:hypothetical protein
MASIPLLGDRSAWDSDNYPERHASDLDGSGAVHHVPAPTVANQFLYSADGISWTTITIEALAELISGMIGLNSERDNMPAYAAGQDTELDSLPAYSAGQNTTTGSLSSYAEGV